MRTFLWAGIAIVFLCIQGAACAGFSVSYTFIDPQGNLTDGTPVTVTCGIPRAGVLPYDQLVFATDLADPVWEPVVVARGQETPVKPAAATADSVTINGAIFSSPAPVQAELRMKLRGTVPYNHTTGQRLLAIRQIDADGFPYAYPSGFLLAMPGAPPKDLPETTLVTATPLIIPVYTGTLSETAAPSDTSSPVPVPATKRIVARTLPPEATPAAAVPGGPLMVWVAAALALLYFRRAGRS